MPPRQGILARLRAKVADGQPIIGGRAGHRAQRDIWLPRPSCFRYDGQPFDDSEARAALLEALRHNRASVRLVELDCHINDPEFADAAAHELLEHLRQASTPSSLHAST